jgi:hypothetical protein
VAAPINQPLLVLEIIIDVRLGDRRFLGDQRCRRASKAEMAEDEFGCIEDVRFDVGARRRLPASLGGLSDSERFQIVVWHFAVRPRHRPTRHNRTNTRNCPM